MEKPGNPTLKKKREQDHNVKIEQQFEQQQQHS
jgi:hypothetical protein